MDPVARKSVVKQGRAHFLLLIWIVLKSWDKTKRLFPDCNDYIPCVSELRTVSRREEGGVISWAWPGQGVYWHQFTRRLVTRDGCDPETERRGETPGWDDEERKWSPSPGPSHHQEIYTRNIFSWIYLLLIDNEGHICKECVVIQPRWSICLTLERGGKEPGQSCLLTRPWMLNRNIESEGWKQLEIIIQYPVQHRWGTSAREERYCDCDTSVLILSN